MAKFNQVTFYEFYLSCKEDEDGAFPVVYGTEEGDARGFLRPALVKDHADVVLALTEREAYVAVDNEFDCRTEEAYLEEALRPLAGRKVDFPKGFRRCHFVAVAN